MEGYDAREKDIKGREISRLRVRIFSIGIREKERRGVEKLR